MSSLLSLIAIGLVGIVVLLVASLLRQNGQTKSQQAVTYTSIGKLLTQTEQKFFSGLLESSPERVHICPKVRIADLLKGASQSDFARISQKHIDFVVIETGSSKVLSVVELDDWTHRRQKVQKRDQFVEAAFRSASIPLIRVKVEESYRYDQIWGEVLHQVGAPAPQKAA